MAYYDGRLNFDTSIDTKGFHKSLARLVKAAAGGATVGTALVAAIKSGIDFESAFAGVKKTVDATEEQLAKLRNGILQMSTEIPLAATEIAGIAEAAGQLGIKTDNIEGFTRVMADLGVATNMTSEQAATSLARLANITQMPQENFDRLGATIVDLGNNLATTESEIVEMALRLAGTGNQVGMTEAQIMAFSGALSSVGIQAEAGGTAFSKLMSDMQLATATGNQDLQNFAIVAGMSAQQFKQAFEQDASQAIIAFIQGLGMAQDSGTSAIKILDDMGITEVRMRDALLRAAGASDVFTEAIQIGNGAWDENTALTKEAQQRYETLESKLQLLKNGLTNLGIAAYEGFQEPLKNAVATATEEISSLTQNMQVGELQAAVQNVGELCGNLVTAAGSIVSTVIPILIQTMSWISENANLVVTATGGVLGYIAAMQALAATQAVITWGKGLYSTFQSLIDIKQLGITYSTFYKAAVLGDATAIKTCSAAGLTDIAVKGKQVVATNAATGATLTMNKALLANPLTIVIGLVGLLAGALVTYSMTADDATNSSRSLIKEMNDMAESYERAKQSAEESTAADLAKLSVVSDTIPRLEELANRTDLTAEEEQELHSIVSGLNEVMPELKLAIDDETNALNMQIGVVWRAVEAYQALAEAKAAESLLVEATKNRMASQKAFDEATEEWETQSSALNKYKNPIQKTIHSIVDNSAGEAYIARQKAAKETLKYMDEETYYKKIFSDLSQKANSALADVKAVQNLSDGGGGGGGRDFSGITSGGGKKSKGTSEAERKTEEARKERVENYQKTVEDEMDAEKRKYDNLKKLGKVSTKDYLANLAYRADTYRGYADDVLNQDYMTAAEREEIRKGWIEKAEDLETEYLLGYIEADKAALDEQVKNGEITQKEYWEKLTALRDKYFVEGSDLWNEYTDEVIEAQKAAITEVYNALAEEALAAFDEIEQAQQALEDKLNGFGSAFRQVVIKNAGEHGEDLSYYRLNDFEEQTAQLSAFQTALEQAKERGKDILGDDLTEYFRQFAEMSSVEDATAQLNALLSASDEEFDRSLTGWKEYRKKSDEIAKDFYKDESAELAKTMLERFQEAFDNVPDTFIENGKLVAEAFGEGFVNQLDEVFRKIQSAIDVNMATVTPSLSAVGGIPVTGYTIDSHNTSIYNLPQTRETTAQNLQAIAAHEEVQRLRGN